MIPLGFGAFVCFGFLLVLTGTSQEGLARDLALDHESFGWLGAWLSLGLGAGVLIAGPIVDRFPRRPAFFLATLLCAAALASVDRDMSLSRACLHLFVIGLGAGFHDTLLNALAVEKGGARSARLLSFLHAGATLGAVVSPPLIGLAPDWTAAFRAGAALYALLAIVVACVPLPAPVRRVRPESLHTIDWRGQSDVIAALGLVAFAYVGVEAALTLFAVPYTQAVLGDAGPRGTFSISAFWLGLLVGRAVLATRRGRTGAAHLAAMGGGGAAALAATPFLPGGVELAFFAVGLGLGGVFPLMVALAGARVPGAPGTVTSLVVGLGSLGGFAVPWLCGALADRLGVASAVGSLALWCGVIVAAAWWARRPPPTFAA